jgi:hypothetical protein
MEVFEKIKAGFERNKLARGEIKTISEDIKHKLNALNKIYVDMLKTHADKNFTFGLDAFYFQHKMLEHDYENICNTLNGIENRMYCEYYKTYKMLQEYVVNEIKDTGHFDKYISKKNYPIYKDLEPLKNYEFGITLEIHQNIIQLILALKKYYLGKDEELKSDKTHTEHGINIDNIVIFQKYTNALLNEKINMFIRYVEVIIKHHTSYLNRLLDKSKFIIAMVNEDIHINIKIPPVESIDVPTASGHTYSDEI